MFPLQGFDWATLGLILASAAVGAGLMKLVARVCAYDPPTTALGPTDAAARAAGVPDTREAGGGAMEQSARVLMVGLPRTWGGRQDAKRAQRVGGLLQLVLRRLAPNLKVELHTTVDAWEWRYRGDFTPQVRERLDTALQLLALQWKRIEETDGLSQDDYERRASDWERLALSLPAHYNAVLFPSSAPAPTSTFLI